VKKCKISLYSTIYLCFIIMKWRYYCFSRVVALSAKSSRVQVFKAVFLLCPVRKTDAVKFARV
jgi:hypothetical protein